jgi:hypothetical protein
LIPKNNKYKLFDRPKIKKAALRVQREPKVTPIKTQTYEKSSIQIQKVKSTLKV